LRTHLPIGFQHDHEGHIVKVADEAMRETIFLIFSKFAELGSARQVTTYLAEEGRSCRIGASTKIQSAGAAPPLERCMAC